MRSFDKQDDVFIRAASDDSQRGFKIEELLLKRKKLMWSANIVTLCALAIALIEACGKSHSGAGVFLIFAAAMVWMLAFNCEADLRLLKVIEMLKSSTR
jgi:hypothetical protein